MSDDRTEEEREYDLFLIELGDSISPAARRELAPLLAAAHHLMVESMGNEER